MKKIYFIFALILSIFSSIFAQNDSLRINKSVFLFYDSSDYVPVLTRLPYVEANQGLLHVQYENLGTNAIARPSARLDITHETFPGGTPGWGLVTSWVLSLDSLNVGEVDTLRFLSCFDPTVLGSFQAEVKLYNSVGRALDSSVFQFRVLDTILSKHTSVSSSVKTGPSFFSDTITGQSGGTVTGDRFATLFELKNIVPTYAAIPTSISIYISNDSNNIGAEFVPKIWEINVDSMGTPNFIDVIVASSFIPTTIGVANLG
ncbi:MAG: hypothetical protein JKY48_01565 [Flavobacteriales bacterium]|nr:hypothetical protein [Flavobacteriales bacterium]